MKKKLSLFFLLVFMFSAQPLCAQYSPAPQQNLKQTGKSERIKVLTGTVRKISASVIWIAEKRNHLTVVYSFRITKETAIEGEPAVGKTARIEYTSKVIRKPDEANTTRKTAVKITLTS